MTQKAPDIDGRSGEQIFQGLAREVKERLQVDANQDPMAEALLRVVSRFAELIIHRLNKVPQKNRDAFVDTLNISRIPPAPAQVPLTFTPVTRLPRSSAPIWVPARTKVAAPPGEGEGEAVVFETTRDVALTNVQLLKVLALDPGRDLYSEKSQVAAASTERGPEGFVFEAGQPVDHEFYLDHGPVSGKGGIPELRLLIEVEPHPFRRLLPHNLQWWIPAKDGKLLLTPVTDTTAQLTQSGEILFKDLPEWLPGKIADREGFWLCCRSLDSLRRMRTSGVTGSELPRETAAISVTWEGKNGELDHAFFNSAPLDLSKDFFPLGERPRFGDVFYLCSPAFSHAESVIAVDFRLTNPASAAESSPLPPVNKDGRPGIQWEGWDGRRWVALVCQDGTEDLTEDGVLSFSVPSSFPITTVNSVAGSWIRGRLVSGSYGEDERYEVVGPEHTLRRIPATLAAPSIQSVTVSSSFRPRRIITNNFVCEERGVSGFFRPFHPAAEPFRALYLGFKTPQDDPLPLIDQPLHLYAQFAPSSQRAYAADAADERPVLAWQYWNGDSWVAAKIEDDTESLTISGTVTVRFGPDLRGWDAFMKQRELFWLRVLWTSGDFPAPPKLRRLLLNTAPAAQTFTIENELMGSSNGLPHQTFRTARVPVLQELQLEIREPDLPPDAELEIIRRAEGDQAVTISHDARGNVEQIWVRWHEVTGFMSSQSRDRQFVVDRQSGEILFGDGVKGMIPPAAANNVRLRSYRTGGGVRGNKPAGRISQLRATVPYVDSVTNLEPSLGGQDFEKWDALRERGAQWLRHRGRAVTVEDYQDVAMLASAVVAKAKCYPNRNLVEDPTGKTVLAGVISVVIVPRSSEPAPLPDLTLLRQVRDFLRERSVPDAELLVVAPEYVSVCVEAFIAPATPHAVANLLMYCEQSLISYLHPLTGGGEGAGWDFGRLPHESGLYALLESSGGVDHVRSLSIRIEEQSPGLLASGIFLVRSGTHRIRPAS